MTTSSASVELKNQNELIRWLIQMIAEEKKISPDDIDADKPFAEMGLDSMAAVTLIGDIEIALDIDIPATALWEYPNINALAPALWKMIQKN